MESNEKEEFVQSVQSDAPRLFLMFLNAKLEMSCLKELLNHGLSDKDLPLKETQYCHKRCGSDFYHLINGQRGFNAAEFLDIHKHQNFSDHVIIPIHFKEKKRYDDYPAEEQNEHYRRHEKIANDPNSISPDGDNDDGDAKTKAYCGAGAYSTVYRINIDPGHHRLSQVSNVKEIYSTRS